MSAVLLMPQKRFHATPEGTEMATRIATAALTGRIYMGRTNKAGNAFAGQKTDVTSDVLKAVIDKAAFHGGTFEIEGGGEKWTVEVKKEPQS